MVPASGLRKHDQVNEVHFVCSPRSLPPRFLCANILSCSFQYFADDLLFLSFSFQYFCGPRDIYAGVATLVQRLMRPSVLLSYNHCFFPSYNDSFFMRFSYNDIFVGGVPWGTYTKATGVGGQIVHLFSKCRTPNTKQQTTNSWWSQTRRKMLCGAA